MRLEFLPKKADSGSRLNNIRQFIQNVISYSKSVMKSRVYLWSYVAFNTVQVLSRRVVGRAEETSTYSSLGFCTVNC